MPNLSRDVSDAVGELMPTQPVRVLVSSAALVVVTRLSGRRGGTNERWALCCADW